MILPPWAPAELQPVFRMYDSPRHSEAWQEIAPWVLDDRLELFWNAAVAATDDEKALSELKVILVTAGGPLPNETAAERASRRGDIADLISRLRTRLAPEQMASKYVKESDLEGLEQELRNDTLPLSILWVDWDNAPKHVHRETARQTHLARRLKSWFREHAGRPCHKEVADAVEVRLGSCDIEVPKA